jgi:hypothetical protein
MMPFAFHRAPRIVALALLGASLAFPMACGGRRILGFGRGEEGVLLVRHTEPTALEILAGEKALGLAQAGGVTCFREVPTGSIRFEARPAGGGDLVRAHTIVLPPEQPLLWDIDHDEVLSGRAHANFCGS